MKTAHNLAVLAVSVVAFAVTACSIAPYAREVKKRPADGGVIALRSTHSQEDRALAESLMRSNCGSNEAKVLEEGEVVTGTKTYSDANTTNESEKSAFSIGGLNFGSGGGQRTSGSAETHQLKEWQLSYQCIAKEQPAPEAISAIKKVSSKKK